MSSIWAHGGPTEEGSLALLCYKHHDDVHLRGWQIVRVAGEREVLVIPPVPLGDPTIRGPARREVV